ncbi:NACHT, LRR and PYD domains-containing protein 3-like [Trachinotus anak]|uniref:NACHT, LRR and PYD domains-containing protein 3-like n=1 Tax=Trachinotus anak TaxID=443729 RepID=UPI0039F210E9
MVTLIELLETLEDLRDRELKNFKWYLQQANFLKEFPSIPKRQLEKADRPDTVDVMVQTYSHQCVEVARRVLKRMRRNDLMESLSNTSSGPEGRSAAAARGAGEADDDGEPSSVQPQAALLSDLPAVSSQSEGEADDDGEPSSVQPQTALHSDLPAVSSQSEDVMVSVLQPPQPNMSLQLMVQSDLQNMFKCAQGGWIERQEDGCNVNPELFVTDGWDGHNNTKHRFRKFETETGKPAESQKPIQPSDFLQLPSIRTVLTNGIVGTGKTFLVQKLLLDWAEQRASQDLHLIFPFTVRQLNLWREERFRLAELIHTCIPETKCIKEETLNDIFTNLQNSSLDKSDFKLLFVFDGLDQSHIHLDLTDATNKSLDVTKSTSVDVLLTNLIRGKLLPSAAKQQISIHTVRTVPSSVLKSDQF